MNCEQLEKLQAERDALKAELDALRGKAEAESEYPEMIVVDSSGHWILMLKNPGWTTPSKEDMSRVKRAYDAMVKLATPGETGGVDQRLARRILSGE